MKRHILLIFLSLLCLDLAAQRKTVGLVLSGGGAKGAAHIGVLKVLEEADIPIDYIAGTSMGAIIGGLYSVGYDSRTLDSLVRAQDWTMLLADRIRRSNLSFSEKEIGEKYLISLPLTKKKIIKSPSGFVAGQNVLNLLSELTIGYHDSLSFDKLPIPFACMAYNMVDGKDVRMDKGYLPLCIRASMSIPGVFEPVKMGDMLLIDGGISNNFPVNVAREMGADVIIGVDLDSGLKEGEALNTIPGLINQITSFIGQENYEKNKKMTDLYIHPDIKPYTSASFNHAAIDTLIRRGEEMARSQWDQIIALRNTLGLSPDSTYRKNIVPVEKNTISIGEITVAGLKHETEKLVRKNLGFKEKSVVSLDRLHEGIGKLKGLGVFSDVSYRLDGVSVYRLEITVREKPASSLSFGARFDTEEMAAVLVNMNIATRKMLGAAIGITGRLSMNPYGKIGFSFGNNFMRKLDLSYEFRYNNFNLYRKGKKIEDLEFNYQMVDLNFSDQSIHNLKFTVGLDYRIFNRPVVISPDDPQVNTRDKGFIDYYAGVHYETLDKLYYPTRGVSLQARYTLTTDNFATYNGHTPFSAVQAGVMAALSASRRVTFIPSLYGRVLIGDSIASPYLNLMGGEEAGRYLPQQLPFTGIGKVEAFENSVVVAALAFRVRVGGKHYLFLKGNYAKDSHSFFDIFSGRDIWGGGIRYSYDSIIGPIGLQFDMSNWDKKLGFYFNLGYYF